MIIEMNAAEQLIYNVVCMGEATNVAPLPPLMANNKPRKVLIIEGGFCSDTRHEEKMMQKLQQH